MPSASSVSQDVFSLREDGSRLLIESFRFVAKFVDGNLQLESDA